MPADVVQVHMAFSAAAVACRAGSDAKLPLSRSSTKDSYLQRKTVNSIQNNTRHAMQRVHLLHHVTSEVECEHGRQQREQRGLRVLVVQPLPQHTRITYCPPPSTATLAPVFPAVSCHAVFDVALSSSGWQCRQPFPARTTHLSR